MSKKDMTSESPAPIRIGLLLIPGFALMGYASLVEGFRAANTLSGRTLYVWRHVSPDGAAAEASSGARIIADARVGDAIGVDRLFVFAGGDPRQVDDPAISAWLRSLARGGCTIGGISGGPFVLARAGLLAGRRATIHWEHREAFADAFADVALERGIYAIDGPVITCAGGTAGLDLALALIARDHGADLAQRVGDWFLRTSAREASGPQRPDPAERHGTTNRTVLTALSLIERGIDQPLSRQDIAAQCGKSLRQLERLFETHLGRSMTDSIRHLRLTRAAHLLRTTDASITQIALECGFASPAHFSRRFHQQFGLAPSGVRRG